MNIKEATQELKKYSHLKGKTVKYKSESSRTKVDGVIIHPVISDGGLFKVLDINFIENCEGKYPDVNYTILLIHGMSSGMPYFCDVINYSDLIED